MAAKGDRLRVLTLVDGVGGGAESLARQIAMNLDRSRFEPTLCVSRPIPPRVREGALAELRRAELPVLELNRGSRADLGAWRRLVAHMRERGIDVLHSHKLGSNAWGAVLSALARVPVFVAHEHTWSFQGQPLRRFLDRELIARRADAFVAVSERDRELMHEVERIPLERLRFIPNGIPMPSAPGAADGVRRELGVEAGQPLIGAVATLRPQKALDVLVRATAALSREHPDLRTLIVGGEDRDGSAAGGTERERLEALAARLGIAEQVLLLGPRDDIPDLLAALDVAVLSSDYEGSPLALMEYMRAGKPVVATRVGGVPELAQDGTTGILVAPRDPEGLAAAVGALLSEPERAAAMGRAGAERCRREFSIEATARRVGALYEELCAVKTGRDGGR